MTTGNLVQHGFESTIDTYLTQGSNGIFLPGGMGGGQENSKFEIWPLDQYVCQDSACVCNPKTLYYTRVDWAPSKYVCQDSTRVCNPKTLYYIGVDCVPSKYIC